VENYHRHLNFCFVLVFFNLWALLIKQLPHSPLWNMRLLYPTWCCVPHGLSIISHLGNPLNLQLLWFCFNIVNLSLVTSGENETLWIIDWSDRLTDWLIDWLIDCFLDWWKDINSLETKSMNRKYFLKSAYTIQQHFTYYIVTTSMIKVNNRTLWALVCNKHPIPYNTFYSPIF